MVKGGVRLVCMHGSKVRSTCIRYLLCLAPVAGCKGRYGKACTWRVAWAYTTTMAPPAGARKVLRKAGTAGTLLSGTEWAT